MSNLVNAIDSGSAHVCHVNLDALEHSTVNEDRTVPRDARMPLALGTLGGGTLVKSHNVGPDPTGLKDLWLLVVNAREFGL